MSQGAGQVLEGLSIMDAEPASHPTKDLVRRGHEGDPQAFVSLVERHRARLQALAYMKMSARLRQLYDVEDVLQEVCVRGWQSFREFEWRGPSSFYSWLSGIVLHVIADLGRSAGAIKRGGGLVLRDGDTALKGVEATDPSPSKLVRREERLERLEKALGQLSEDHREVIFLARLQLLPMKEVARRMGRTVDAVSELLRRALRKLKDIFGDTESAGLPEGGLLQLIARQAAARAARNGDGAVGGEPAAGGPSTTG